MLSGLKGNFPNFTSKEIGKNTQIPRCDNSIKNCNRLGQHLTVSYRTARFSELPQLRAQTLSLGVPNGAHAYHVSCKSN